MTTQATIAEVEHVIHHYGATVALDDVSIEIPARRMVGLIGPDGVGKSTLLALIAGVRTFSRAALRSSAATWPTEHIASAQACAHRLYAAGPRPQPLPDA